MYDLTALATELKNYVDGNKKMLLIDSVATSDDTSFMSLMPNTATDAPVIVMNLDAKFQSAANCGFTPENTDISNRIVKVHPIKSQYEWCENQLLNTALASEFSKDEMAFAEKLSRMVVEKNSRELNRQIWTGKIASGDQIDGIVEILDAEVTAGTITPITNSRTNYMDRIKDTYLAIDARYVAGTELFMGPTAFRTLIMELNDAKVINYNLNITDGKSFTYPGTNLKVNMIEGLGNSTAIIAAEPENFVLATDFEKDSIRIWHSEDNETFRATWMVCAGVQLAFVDRVVYNKN